MNISTKGELFRGHIDTIILRILYGGQRYGYDIIREIEQKSGGTYKIKQATLYSCLRRLEEQGFLTSYWGERDAGARKKYYALTKMGREVFLKNEMEWQESKHIIDNLVLGEGEYNPHNLHQKAYRQDQFINEQNQHNHQNFQNQSDLEQNFQNQFDLEQNQQNHQNFQNHSNAEQNHQDTQELRSNFERIFDSLKPEKSYVDNMVNQTYQPTEKPDKKALFNFFDSDEMPFFQSDAELSYGDSVADSADSSEIGTTDDSADAEGEYIDEHGLFGGGHISLENVEQDCRELPPEYGEEEIEYETFTQLESQLEEENETNEFNQSNGKIYAKEGKEGEDYHFLEPETNVFGGHDLNKSANTSTNTTSISSTPNISNTPNISITSNISNISANSSINSNQSTPPQEIAVQQYSTSQQPTNQQPTSQQQTNQQQSQEDPQSPALQKAKQIMSEAKAQSTTPNSPPPPQCVTKPESEFGFYKYNSSGGRILSDTEIISRDYQFALDKLVKNIKRQPQTEALNTRIQQEKKLESVRQDAVDMGDAVIVRRHNNAVKQYNSENYFYKNRLMLVHYGIMFLFMLVQISVCFAVFELVIKGGKATTNTDLWVYISGVLIGLALPSYAFLSSYADYNKRKMRDRNYRGSLIFRIMVVLQIWVIVSGIAAYNGIFTSDFKGYLATFVVPCVIALNLVWSYLVYISLLNSKKFNV